MAQRIKQYLFLTLLFIGAAVAQAFVTKAAIGVLACWDTVSLNVYEICGLKIGTFGIVANCLMVLVQFLILRSKFDPQKLLSVPIVVVFGITVNAVYYGLLADFNPDSYAVRVITLVGGLVVLAFFLGAITAMDAITMPLEGTVNEVHRLTGWSFGVLRVSVDVACIAVSLILSFTCGLSYKVREGTVIGMVLLGPLEGFFMNLTEAPLKKMGLIVPKSCDENSESSMSSVNGKGNGNDAHDAEADERA